MFYNLLERPATGSIRIIFSRFAQYKNRNTPEDISEISPVPGPALNRPRAIHQVTKHTLRNIEQTAVRQTKPKSNLIVKCPICKFKVVDEWRHKRINTPGQLKEHGRGSHHLKAISRLKEQDKHNYCFFCKKSFFNKHNFAKHKECEKH